MSTFVVTFSFLRSALCVAMETMRFHIAQIGLFFRALFSPIQVVFQNHLTHIRSFPDRALFVCFVCLFGSLRRINPCGSLASDGIKLNMMKMEKVKIYKIK